jgi:Ser/Thr protein kinase RdoA (MazF antagonist)
MQNDSSQTIIQKMMTTNPPVFSDTEATRIAAAEYGIQSGVRPLVSERDQNFRLDADNGRRYTLKFSNDAEQLQVIDFQNQALLHVADKDPSLPLPRVIPNLEGQLHSVVRHGDKSHYVRVLSWLDGCILNDAVAEAGLANRLGRMLARLGIALSDFDHPGSNPPSLWDMKRAAGLRVLLPHTEDPGLRQLIASTLDTFDSKVTPVLDRLRTQVIHNDMNLGNVLVEESRRDRICGVIDFGDMVKSPLVMDLAIAAAYQLSDGEDPLAGALPMIAGYHAVCPLEDIEMELLTDLIRTRLITSLLINAYRVQLFPENREYLMISHGSSKRFLVNLERLDAGTALQRIRAACSAG